MRFALAATAAAAAAAKLHPTTPPIALSEPYTEQAQKIWDSEKAAAWKARDEAKASKPVAGSTMWLAPGAAGLEGMDTRQFACSVDNLTKNCPGAASMKQLPATAVMVPRGAHVLMYGTSWMRQYSEAVVSAHLAAGDVEGKAFGPSFTMLKPRFGKDEDTGLAASGDAPQRRDVFTDDSYRVSFKGGGSLTAVHNNPYLQVQANAQAPSGLVRFLARQKFDYIIATEPHPCAPRRLSYGSGPLASPRTTLLTAPAAATLVCESLTWMPTLPAYPCARRRHLLHPAGQAARPLPPQPQLPVRPLPRRRRPNRIQRLGRGAMADPGGRDGRRRAADVPDPARARVSHQPALLLGVAWRAGGRALLPAVADDEPGRGGGGGRGGAGGAGGV